MIWSMVCYSLLGMYEIREKMLINQTSGAGQEVFSGEVILEISMKNSKS